MWERTTYSVKLRQSLMIMRTARRGLWALISITGQIIIKTGCKETEKQCDSFKPKKIVSKWNARHCVYFRHMHVYMDTYIYIHVHVSMGWCKKDVTPLPTHWSYAYLSLTHRYMITIYDYGSSCSSQVYAENWWNEVWQPVAQATLIFHVVSLLWNAHAPFN